MADLAQVWNALAQCCKGPGLLFTPSTSSTAFGALPLDRGCSFTPNAAAAGTPAGAGFIMVLSLIPVLFLVVPLSGKMLQVNDCVALAMLIGFLNDRSAPSWGEFRKGALDLLVAALPSFVLCHGHAMTL